MDGQNEYVTTKWSYTKKCCSQTQYFQEQVYFQQILMYNILGSHYFKKYKNYSYEKVI